MTLNDHKSNHIDQLMIIISKVGKCNENTRVTFAWLLYLIFGQRFAQRRFVGVDQQGTVVVRVRLTQFRGRARYLKEDQI